MSSHRDNKNRTLFILLLTYFLDWISIGLVFPMFSTISFHQETIFFAPETCHTIRGAWLGILLASGPLGQFFGAPIIGTISDQKGRRPLLKYTLLAVVIGYLFCSLGAWAGSLILILIGRLIVGVGTGNTAVVYAAMSDISTPEEKAKRFGLLSMSGGIGFTGGPLLGGLLIAWGFATPFLFALACSIINFTLAALLFSETHHLRRAVTLSFALGLKNLKKAFQMPFLRLLFLSLFFFFAAWSFYWEFIPITWMQKYGLTSPQVGIFYAYGSAFYALSTGLLIRPFVKRFQPFSIFLVALILLSFAILSLLFIPNIQIYWILIPIQQFLIALVFPTSTTVVSNTVKEDAQGEIMGILQSVDSFAFGVSPLLAGVFAGLGAQTPIIIAGSFLILSFLILLKARKSIFI